MTARADNPGTGRFGQTERWLPPALLAVAAALSILVDGVTHAPTTVIAALTLATATWSVLGWPVVRDSHAPERLDAGRLAWFAGFAALMVALCELAPLYGFAAWTGYLFVLRIFPARLLWAGALLVALATAASQLGGQVGTDPALLPAYGGLLLANTAIGGFALYWGHTAERERSAREAALREAEAANARLEEALAENRALQGQLVLGAREAGVADERGRLAREIHDTIAQGLTGIVRQLEAADGAPADEVARRIDTARTLARDSLSEARRSVQALRPEPLEAAQLPDALTTVTDDWSRLHGIPAVVTTTGAAQRLRPEIDVALLRTAQEALANVGKHARASRVGVTLSYMGDAVTLDVRDDGIGFGAAPHDRPADGYGLQSMRERLAAVDGRLLVESAPGDGTAVSASVPALEA